MPCARRFSRAGGLLHRLFTISELARWLPSAYASARLLARLSVVCFLWHFPSRAIAARLPPLTSGPSALRSPDFPLPCGSDRSLARHFRRNFKDQRYRMRPHIVHATMFWGLPASPSFSFASTICDTLGGWTRWHPSHTPSCVSATTTGQRFVLRRS